MTIEGFTLKIFVIVLAAYLFVTTWGEVINRSLIEYFDLDKEKVETYVKLGVGFTILLLLIIVGWNVEFHDLFGISETVDVKFTGMKETFRNGKLKHYPVKKKSNNRRV